MPEDVEQTYLKAKKASVAGSLCMYFLAVISALGCIAFIVSATNQELLGSAPYDYKLVVALCTLSTTIAITLLGEFLRHFVSDPSPFGKRQSLRLLISGLLFAIRLILDGCFPGKLYSLSFFANSDAIAITTQPGPDLKVVVMVVFLICLAMVIRYGNALKEDSDSIA